MIQATLCFITLFSLSMSATIQNADLQKNMNKELLYMGTYGDKVYFTETSDMTWDQANAYCNSHGMALVSASTPGEVDFLINLTVANTRFWTSGRRGSDVFTWGNGNVIEESVVTFHDGCVIILGGYARLLEDPCDGSLGHVYNPLCQA